jgi:hypothetical protein
MSKQQSSGVRSLMHAIDDEKKLLRKPSSPPSQVHLRLFGRSSSIENP